MIKTVCLFDTSVSSPNLWDQIIMESSDLVLKELFLNDYVFKIPSHNCISWRYTEKIIKQSRFVVFCWTNAISSNMIFSTWAKIKDFFLLKNKVILFWVWWWNYSNSNSLYAKCAALYSKFILRRFLSKEYTHSVRDEYTKKKLESFWIKNVINTWCQTMWQIDKNHCKSIPVKKSKNVIFTLTVYNKSIDEDLFLIELLKKNYERLYFWPQQPWDYEYLCEIDNLQWIEILNPNIDSFENKLMESNIEYVWTRLHAWIKAIQKYKRSIIIWIDNRAIEMWKDFNLNVIKRSELKKSLNDTINSDLVTDIKIDFNRINLRKSQF